MQLSDFVDDRHSDHSEDSDAYGTPAWIIRRLHRALGDRFGLDPCSGAEPIPIAHRSFTEADDGLTQDWTTADTMFLNPPYSDPKPWMRKLVGALESDDGPRLALALLKCDPSTEWFTRYVVNADYLCLFGDRISFYGSDGGAGFPSMIAAFGDVTDDLLAALDDFGSIYTQHTLTSAQRSGCLPALVEDGGTAVAPLAGQTGPSTGGVGVSLDRLTPYDQLTVTFDTSRLGAVRDLPGDVIVDVLPDGKSFDTTRGEISVNTLAPNRLPDGRDLYVQLRESAYASTRVEVAVSVDGRPWELASVDDIQHATHEPARPEPGVTA